MDIKQLNEQLEKFLIKPITENVETELDLIGNYNELLQRTQDFDVYLVHNNEKGYCITVFTFEYNHGELNYKSNWYPTKEEAIKGYEKETGDILIIL